MYSLSSSKINTSNSNSIWKNAQTCLNQFVEILSTLWEIELQIKLHITKETQQKPSQSMFMDENPVVINGSTFKEGRAGRAGFFSCHERCRLHFVYALIEMHHSSDKNIQKGIIMTQDRIYREESSCPQHESTRQKTVMTAESGAISANSD